MDQPEFDEEDGDEDTEEFETLPEALSSWIEGVIRDEMRSFLDHLWEEGGLRDVLKDAVREGAAEAVEDVASKQPWRQLLGGEKRR